MATAHACGATGAANYDVQIEIREHTLHADEPSDAGGQNAGPTAVELVAGALCACTATTLKMYAGRKGWELQHVDVSVELDWRGMSLTRTIGLTGALDNEQRARLMQIADACPVHKMLAGSVAVTTVAAT